MSIEAERARVTNKQLWLYNAPTVRDTLEETLLCEGVTRQLYYDGHLSFEPDLDRGLRPSEEAELLFLGHLARIAGARNVGRYLAKLRAPYAFDIWQLAYDFAREEWRFIERAAAVEASWPA
ncbi:MAG: hypothetical protein EP330_13750 [Deltaproteobacteria bacterium]|nr:MAG: hypothetical protein EP330_13750 [Deltaproteobacteria bacterium]